MRRKLLNWTIKLSVLTVLLLGLLVLVVLTPSLLYANKTQIGTYTIYHNKPLDKDLKLRLDNTKKILMYSEYYDPNIEFKICMNDGSYYPALMQTFLGRAFALGYTSNIVTLCGDEVNIKRNYVRVNDCKWNLTQLLAHEETHCYLFNKLGFWKTNPVAHYPIWKWEGYPEYISRQADDQKDLMKNIEKLNNVIKEGKDGWGISFADSTLTSKDYFRYRLLIQYCLDVKEQTYENLLLDTTSEQTTTAQMMNWYSEQK